MGRIEPRVFALRAAWGLALLCSALWVFAAMAQTLEAQVDRVEVAENETVQLTVSYAGQVSTDALNFDVLNQDFRVLGVTPSSRTQIINGVQSSSTVWQVALMPRRAGALRIPAFTVNGVSSRAIELSVSKASRNAAGLASESSLDVRVNADRQRAYVGEQILITVRLTGPNQMSRLNGDELKLDGAEVTLIDQQQFQRMIKGQIYQVVEWRYAVFPQRRGSLWIPEQVFSTLVGAPSGFSFDLFRQRGKRIYGRSEAQEIDVRAAPDTAGKVWFPASDVQISADWSASPDDIQVGEPVTREVKIAAVGQHAAAIPPLNLSLGQDFKTYSDQPVVEDTNTKAGIFGVRSESLAIVPTAAGLLVLPEVRIDWWDIENAEWKQAVLPAESIQVTSVGGQQAVAPPSSDERSGQPVVEGAKALLSATSDWPVRAAIAVTLVLALCCILLWAQNRRLRARLTAPARTVSAPPVENEQRAWRTLQRTLDSRSYPQIREAVIAWAGAQWPAAKVFSLEDVVALGGGNGALERVLGDLDQAIYRQRTGEALSPDLAALRTALKQLRSAKHLIKSASSELPRLYPRKRKN